MDNSTLNLILEGVYEASAQILHIYQSDFSVYIKGDRSPITEADRLSNATLTKALNNTGMPIISEEGHIPPYEVRKKFDAVWIVDPLDGTKEFVNKNDEFCICIALVKDSKTTFGIIADPLREQIIYGGPSTGSYSMNYGETDFWSEEKKLELTIPEKKGLVYSRSHFSEKVLGIVDSIEKKYGKLDVLKKGSALKFFDLVNSEAQFYPRLAPTMEWDIAAGQAIYEGIGGEVIDFINFESLRYNKESLYNPYFIAKPKQLKIADE